MPSAAEYLPPKRTLKALEQAAQGCRGCDLYKDATQTVFGEGRSSAQLMLVGEQPGDKEDGGVRCLRRRSRSDRQRAAGRGAVKAGSPLGRGVVNPGGALLGRGSR